MSATSEHYLSTLVDVAAGVSESEHQRATEAVLGLCTMGGAAPASQRLVVLPDHRRHQLAPGVEEFLVVLRGHLADEVGNGVLGQVGLKVGLIGDLAGRS